MKKTNSHHNPIITRDARPFKCCQGFDWTPLLEVPEANMIVGDCNNPDCPRTGTIITSRLPEGVAHAY